MRQNRKDRMKEGHLKGSSLMNYCHACIELSGFSSAEVCEKCLLYFVCWCTDPSLSMDFHKDVPFQMNPSETV